MRHRFRIFALSMAAVLLTAAVVAHPGDGTLVGRVVDGSGRELAGVVVRITGEAVAGTRTLHSDRLGRFVANVLPPGAYGVSFDLAGHQWVEFEDLRLAVGSTVSLEVVMQAVDGDEVVVFSGGPALAAAGTEDVSVVEGDALAALPGDRSRPPGSNGRGLRSDTTVCSAVENATWPAHSSAPPRLPVAAVAGQRVERAAAGVHRPGSIETVVDLAARGGGDRLRGEVAADLGGGQAPTAGGIGGRGGQWAMRRQGGLGLSMGGPVAKDRLWAFGALHLASAAAELSGAEQPLVHSRDSRRTDRSLFARLSWRPGDRQRVEAELRSTGSRLDDDLPDPYFLAANEQAGFDDRLAAALLSLDWDGLVGETTLISTGFTTHGLRDEMVPKNQELMIQDLSSDGRWSNAVGNGVFAGGSGFPGTRSEARRNELRADVYWAGAAGHRLRAGGSWQRWRHSKSSLSGWTDATGFCAHAHPGGVLRYDPATAEWLPTGLDCDSDGDGSIDGLWLARGHRVQLGDQQAALLRFSGLGRGGGDHETAAAFVEDRWSPAAGLTLVAGLRAQATEVRPSTTAVASDRELDTGLLLDPRFGVVWDFEGNGRSRLYLHAGRYSVAPSWTTVRRVLGLEDAELALFEAQAAPAAAELGGLRALRPASSLSIDRSAEATSFNEVVVGADYEVLGDLVVGISALLRTLEQALVELSLDGGASVVITNLGASYVNNPATGEPLAEPVRLPEAQRREQSISLHAHRRLKDGWQFFTSLTWSEVEGNVELARCSTAYRADSGYAIDFLSPESLDNARGPLAADRRWRFLVWGSYAWQDRATAAAVFSYTDGAPLSRLGALSMGRGADQRFVSRRGSAGRGPGVWNLDLRLGAPLQVGDARLELFFEVRNLLGGDDPVLVDQRWSVLDEVEAQGLDSNAQRTNPNWGQAMELQAPRNFQLGLRYSF